MFDTKQKPSFNRIRIVKEVIHCYFDARIKEVSTIASYNMVSIGGLRNVVCYLFLVLVYTRYGNIR